MQGPAKRHFSHLTTSIRCSYSRHLQSMVLPDHLIMHIMSFLPSSHKAAVAKLVCKEAHQAFEEYKSISIASCDDLPSDCVLQALKQLQQSEQHGMQPRLMAAVVHQGNLPRLQLLRNHGCDWSSLVSAAAAEAGHLKILQWLRAQDPPCPWDKSACWSAAASGHLEVLQWIKAQESDPPLWQNTCNHTCEAIKNEGALLGAMQMETGQDLHKGLYSLLILTMLCVACGVCEAAARHGHLHILRWLRAQSLSCDWNKIICVAAARGGQLEVLQWLRAQDPPYAWNELVFKAAVMAGHLDAMQWLRAQDPPCPWSARACSAAAANGLLQVLQWLRSQEPPCPWSTDVIVYAARHGDLDVLEWALAQNPPAPWHQGACLLAALFGQLHILQWVEAHQPALPWSKAECLRMAQERGEVAIVDWLESLAEA